MPPAPSDTPTGNRPKRSKRSGSGARRDGGVPAPKLGKDGSPPRGAVTAEEKRRIEALSELERVEKEIKELEKRRRELTPTVAAMQPPTQRFKSFKGKREGFSYTTWFKAIGSMESLAELKGGDSPSIVNEMMEFDDYDIPSAFYSHSILGKVKWKGIRDRERIIAELNFVAPWSGNDFRDIYSKWEYTYRVVESVGDVPVNIYEYRAKQPRTNKDKSVGWNPQ